MCEESIRILSHTHEQQNCRSITSGIPSRLARRRRDVVRTRAAMTIEIPQPVNHGVCHLAGDRSEHCAWTRTVRHLDAVLVHWPCDHYGCVVVNHRWSNHPHTGFSTLSSIRVDHLTVTWLEREFLAATKACSVVPSRGRRVDESTREVLIEDFPLLPPRQHRQQTRMPQRIVGQQTRIFVYSVRLVIFSYSYLICTMSTSHRVTITRFRSSSFARTF